MFPAERRRKIVALVNSRGSVRVSELSELFSVSEMTIHRDLAILQKEGLLEKAYGGAIAKHPLTMEPDFLARLSSCPQEKDDIAASADELVAEGDCVILDASTTCLALAKRLRGKGTLIVFTTGPHALLELSAAPGVKVYSSGGLLSKQTMSFVGPETERFLERIHVDKCFMGANGITIEHGVTDPFPWEVEIKRRIAEASDTVYLLADHTKFGHVAMISCVPLSAIDLILTDAREPNPYLAELDRADIGYMLCEPLPGTE